MVYNGNLKLIAVTGPTGAGKSTFINCVCGSNLKVGSGLRSCTTNIDVAYCMMDDTKVVLIDTPGFDDTTKSQADVLEDIGKFLKRTYERDILLSGVIYMHRISDRRVGGIARENFRLFGKICGPKAMKNVLIVTSMWEEVSEEIGSAREQELASKAIFYQPAIEAGAKMIRHYNYAESARMVVSTLLANLAQKLQMQCELVEQKKQVPETAAGVDLLQLLREQEERYQRQLQDLVDEMRDANRAEVMKLREELKKTREELRRTKKEAEKMEVGSVRRLLQAGFRVEFRTLFCLKVYRVLES